MIENDVSGVLVKPQNPSVLAEAILILMKDMDRRIIYGHNAMVRIRKKFSVKTVCDQWEKLYRECIYDNNNLN